MASSKSFTAMYEELPKWAKIIIQVFAGAIVVGKKRRVQD